MKAIELSDLIADRVPSLDPKKFSDEDFELWSIPSYDIGKPEIVSGREIGSSKKCVANGDVLLSRIVPHIRRAWIVESDNSLRKIASGEWIVFRSKRFHPQYLRHFLLSDSFHSEFMRTVAGVGGSLLRARPDGVKKIKMSLPNIDEQKRIAALLDQADELRRARRKSIDRLNDLSQAIFYEMFGNLSGFPKKALRDLGKVSTGSTPPTKESSYFDGEIPFVTPGDLGSGMYAKRTLSLEGSKKSRLVQAGATLVCCIGATIGKMDIAHEECAFNQQINAIQWGDDVDPVYGLFAMGAIRDEIVHKGKGASTTLPILKKSEFEKLMIFVPPKELQVKFAKVVNRINGNISLFKKDLFVREHLFYSLQQKAFSEKI